MVHLAYAYLHLLQQSSRIYHVTMTSKTLILLVPSLEPFWIFNHWIAVVCSRV